MPEKILTLKIEQLAFGGEGVGKPIDQKDGKVVFVPWTVPGDTVNVRILSDHGRYERAELLEVLHPSPDRVTPRCPLFGQCGGCQWQHLNYEAQLKSKESILAETLSRVGHIENPRQFMKPIIPMSHDPWHYRQRIQIKTQAGKIGFYRMKSHQVIDVEECLIADPLLNRKLNEFRKNPQTLVAPGDGIEISIHGVVHDQVFSQVNSQQNDQLIQTVLNMSFGNADIAFTRKKTVVECHAGSGNLTFPIAARVGKVIAIESHKASVRQGQELTLEKNIAHLEWILGTAEWGLKKIYRNRQSVDLLILDPPRHGAKEILDLIPLIRPRVIVYVSCDPVTLSRDLDLLLRRHYRLEHVQPIDMFPQTYHIESVSRLVLA